MRPCFYSDHLVLQGATRSSVMCFQRRIGGILVHGVSEIENFLKAGLEN
jgi:hypothetical protein